MNPIAVRTRRERAPAAEVRRALKRFRDYKDAGKHREISAVLEKHSISNNALNVWLNKPDDAPFATKAPYLVLAAKELPSLRQEKKHRSYALLLQELGLKPNHAEQLSQLGGTYSLILGAQIKDLKFDGQLAIVTSSPGVVFFWTRYEARGHPRKFDGLVVERNSIVHLIGLSEHNMFIAHLRAVRNPSREVMYGTLAFEELSGVGYVRFALVPDGHRMSEREKAFTNEQLGMPIC
ncbi:MAG TPA: hypothetical protein VMM15_18685 [Bradyrhizobium sp.]|nr:hypothetical protein [Bradyrhizobium sp.]